MNYHALVQSITALHADSVGRAASAVNQALVLRNWVIGAHIVEFEQSGEDRAEYGTGLLRRLSSDLCACGIKGVSPDMLERMRLFSRHYPQLAGSMSAPLVRISTKPEANPDRSSSAPAVRKSETDTPAPLSPELVFRFTWTHLADLVRIDDPWKRAFYEIECLNGNWSKRQLQRQIGSLLYERTALSTDKAAVIERARRQSAETPSRMSDPIRDPYVLEFVGLAERSRYTENELESALLDHLQSFLLELGTGFCFEAALRRLRKTWAKGIDDIVVTLLGIGSRESFLEVGGNAIPELASSATWVSQTPFIPPRFLKADGKDSLEGQVRAELRRRALPDLATAPMVTLPSGEDAAGHQARRFRHFARTRREGGIPRPPPGLFHLTLTFPRAVAGPLCLGWGCHFGLGLFAPAPDA